VPFADFAICGFLVFRIFDFSKIAITKNFVSRFPTRQR
jgi:hypothetical protein